MLFGVKSTHDDFGTVENTQRSNAVAEPSADYFGGVAHCVHSFCVFREKSLVGSKHAAYKRKYYLSAVRMTCKYNVKTVLCVCFYELGSVRQQNIELFLVNIELLQRAVGVINAMIGYTVQIKRDAVVRYFGFLVFEKRDACRRKFFLEDRVLLRRVVFVIAGNIVHRRNIYGTCNKFHCYVNIGMSAVYEVARDNDDVWILLFDYFEQS